MEGRFYHMLSRIQRRHPNLVLDLPKKDGVWEWRAVQMGGGLITSVVFPVYKALAPYQPNEEHYQAWKQSKHAALLQSKYRARWVAERYVRLYRNVLLLSAVVAAPFVPFTDLQDALSTEFVKHVQQAERTLDDLSTHP